ncbi:MAG TPA: serine--tRNA ligase [Candidatus Saccharimonadales bacterium]|nr:serine--tRNA ligase [Candidatus Saccharimonadales bacterium]
MIDINFVRENSDEVKRKISSKNFDPKIVDEVLKLDEKRRKFVGEVGELRAKRNEAAKEKDIEKGKKIKKELQELEPKAEEAEKEFLEKLSAIPNLPFDNVPLGKGEKDNVELRKVGKISKLSFKAKDHLEIGTKLGIIDFETGAKVSGSQFYYLYGDGARLELALINYAFEKLSEKGFIPVMTPDLAKSRFYLGTGYSPKGNEAQTYTIDGEDLGLIATAEVTLAGKNADEVLTEAELPLKYIGYSHCFRQEAGAYGKYSKGLYRVHQFTKAEMFVYCLPEDSEKFHKLLLEIEEEIYKDLEIPYRVLEMCTGDLGAMAARKYDIEAWMAGRGEYGEVTSTSNVTDYQARNLNIRYKKNNGERGFLHMLNGTAIATSRTIIAILENYQNEDGSVSVPKVLQKWMGKEVITSQA